MTEAAPETIGFQAEVRQLLHLVVHSLYSHPDIVVRELVSNASDATDKLRFEALQDEGLYEGVTDLRITVHYDKAARTLSFADRGIGMSRDEVVSHLGTIARSGTREFLAKLSGDASRDSHLIGQFGVGFYSSFILADRVMVRTRRAGLPASEGVVWTSDGTSDYTLASENLPNRGTTVTLHLKADADEFLDPYRLKAVIRKYSDHLTVPIEITGEAHATPELVNEGGALWGRPKSEITPEEYRDLYQRLSHDTQPPLATLHTRVEGRQDYTLLLFVPSEAPLDLMDRDRRSGPKLYVRRVFIMEDAGRLLPHYLRFIRGVIDADHLPLNVSRELLQESRDLDAIRQGATRKILDLLTDLAAQEPDKYATFIREFGNLLKEGVIEDSAQQERIAKLLRFQSTSGEPLVSLEAYVARMRPGQDRIYYLTADSLQAASGSPHLEIFRQKGVEVLLLTDRVDEWLVAHLHSFDGKALQSVAKAGIDLSAVEALPETSGTAGAPPAASAVGDLAPLLERLQSALGERVKAVRASTRLTTSAACVVADEHDLGLHLERLLRAAGQTPSQSRPVLEINPGHPLVAHMAKEADEARFRDQAEILWGEALLSDGALLPNPADFVERLNRLLLAGPDRP